MSYIVEERHYGSFWTLIGQENLSTEVMICDSMALLCDGGKGRRGWETQSALKRGDRDGDNINHRLLLHHQELLVIAVPTILKLSGSLDDHK